MADATISAGDGCAPFSYGRGGSVNAAPTAVAQARPTEAAVGEAVTFDGSGSYDDQQAASDLTYVWDFGDGASATGQTAHHAYEDAGEYTAKLTVTDADGAHASDTLTIAVTGSAPEADLVIASITTIQATGGGGGKPREGDKVRIRAVVENTGAADAAATATAFTLDGEALPGSPVATAAIPAGGSVAVELSWDTRVSRTHT